MRRVYAVSDVDRLSTSEEWPGLRRLVCVERERTIKGKKTSIERVHCITSIPAHHVRRLARIIRSHWGIENALHWSLDVSFREDASRIRSENGPEKFALLRCISLVLLRRRRQFGAVRQRNSSEQQWI
nr:ISAs1 family transposase [Deltaproteobacteria bacterium]